MMKAFIFVILFGVLLFNSILVHEKKSDAFSLTAVIYEYNQSKEANGSFDIVLHQKYPEVNQSVDKINTSSMEINQTIIESNQTLSNKIITLAQSKLGSPYIYADTGPNSFDCSGFVYYLFKEQNISIPRTSLAQSQGGREINRTQIQRGDLVFFDTSNKGHVNHSGIYLGEDKFIHASSGKAKGVTISKMNGWYKDKFLWGLHRTEENLSNPLQNMSHHQTPKSSQDIP